MFEFDFISTAEFRQSLKDDYSELIKSVEQGNWKSVHVLAGSIVEALLIDYILATQESSGRKSKDPLKMDLAEAIAICLSENVISSTISDLSSVIRSYRNLIHPGRIVRLREKKPSEDSAKIALSLVRMIVEEIANQSISTFGLTGEQVVSKIERDAGFLNIFRHVIRDIPHPQVERLLLELIPEKYFQSKNLFEDDNSISKSEADIFLQRFEKCYRLIFNAAPESTKIKVAENFIKILHNADGERVVFSLV